MPTQGLKVTGVTPGGIGDEIGVQPGDIIMEINSHPVRDIIDYRFLVCDEEISVKLIDAAGEQWILEIEKDYDEDLGLDFGAGAFGATRRCQNKCLFCFVDQMAPNMRSTLYVKDDDYRLSFWQGNFVTLTNVNGEELQRIIKQRLSPLYISVHTTNPDLRRKLMRNARSAKIMEQLSALAEAGIEMHTQVVLCPGINDGPELQRTVKDLAGLWPSVQSLAVVPVGLTKYREGLAELKLFDEKTAREIINQIHGWQERFIDKFQYPFVFASDEFYVMAQEPFPPDERYADYPQTENGVGLARLFLDQWHEVEKKLPLQATVPRKVTVATGLSAFAILEPVINRLNKVKGVNARLLKIPHHFFGETVTVAGLLTGSDMIKGLKNKSLGDMLIIPSAMLKNQGEEVFLDDMTVEQLAKRLKVPVYPAGNPAQLVEIILTGGAR
ncbi:DUF512 domain-containing protein [Desulfofalx alkaliphila]|uniref:DUF512 domain-containing protein n=1 Tax=Desulfofalx alkaliphila TaxID=105483 RepID=UPI0004E0C978|nr:DUF512 domain-containing protein [Desulfofalx alkaliphila]